MTIAPKVEEANAEPVDASDMRLVKDRDRIYPMAVSGRFRQTKWTILVACLSIYYLLPWLRWDRGPGRPDQALLLDIWNERMYIFGLEFWPQDIYLLAGAMILAAFALFMVTSLIGRVWCGYTCPQTVWTDLFLWVERVIEGDRNERMKRDARPLNFDTIWRKTAKHSIWLVVAFWTGGAWIMYYTDAPTVTRAFWTGHASFQVYFFTALFTATTYLLAGWAREQVCTYMCPWPRFQAAMLDDQTVTVTYQGWRGEPRGNRHKNDIRPDLGDCVDCKACLHVCPMGIDIRDGQQLECISCSLCIDACDTVMRKLDRPHGLIVWDNLARQSAKSVRTRVPGLHFIRPRTLIYCCLLMLGMGGMAYATLNRSDLGLTIQRDRAPLFVRLADGSLRNGYTLSIMNKRPDARRLELSVEGLPDAELSLPESNSSASSIVNVTAEADTVTDIRVLVKAAAPSSAKTQLGFVLRDPLTGTSKTWSSVFISSAAE